MQAIITASFMTVTHAAVARVDYILCYAMFWGMPHHHGPSAAENRGHRVGWSGFATDPALALDVSQHPRAHRSKARALPGSQPEVLPHRPATGSLARRSARYTVVRLTPRTSPICATVMSCCSYRRRAVRT